MLLLRRPLRLDNYLLQEMYICIYMCASAVAWRSFATTCALPVKGLPERSMRSHGRCRAC